MKAACLIFVLVVTLPSCRQTGDVPTSATQRATQPFQPSEADNWHRTKDCAARVDAMGKGKPSSNLQEGRIAHYSRKYGRCFVKITHSLTVTPRDDERKTSVMLMDAFEGSIGAMLPFVGPCYLGGKEENCAKAEAFIDDAMTN